MEFVPASILKKNMDMDTFCTNCGLCTVQTICFWHLPMFSTFTHILTNTQAENRKKRKAASTQALLPAQSRCSVLLLIPFSKSTIYSEERGNKKGRGAGRSTKEHGSWLKELRWREHLRAQLNKGHSLKREGTEGESPAWVLKWLTYLLEQRHTNSWKTFSDVHMQRILFLTTGKSF